MTPRRRFPVRRLPDGRAFLNLGSAGRVAPGWNNVDGSWLLRLGRRPILAAVLHRIGLVSGQRYARMRKLDRAAIPWNLKRGIPFPPEAFDGVYQSHLLEHVEREEAPALLAECFRVLKRGGTLRVVVPDLEALARRYVRLADRLPDPTLEGEYDRVIEEIFEQMTRRTPVRRRGLPPAARLLENVVIGSTARSGELHRWMYDRFSLERLLAGAGFADVAVLGASSSRIEGWSLFGLDTESDGSPHKPGSLTMEARRP